MHARAASTAPARTALFVSAPSPSPFLSAIEANAVSAAAASVAVSALAILSVSAWRTTNDSANHRSKWQSDAKIAAGLSLPSRSIDAIAKLNTSRLTWAVLPSSLLPSSGVVVIVRVNAKKKDDVAVC
jgi:hypothetical protein